MSYALDRAARTLEKQLKEHKIIVPFKQRLIFRGNGVMPIPESMTYAKCLDLLKGMIRESKTEKKAKLTEKQRGLFDD